MPARRPDRPWRCVARDTDERRARRDGSCRHGPCRHHRRNVPRPRRDPVHPTTPHQLTATPSRVRPLPTRATQSAQSGGGIFVVRVEREGLGWCNGWTTRVLPDPVPCIYLCPRQEATRSASTVEPPATCRPRRRPSACERRAASAHTRSLLSVWTRAPAGPGSAAKGHRGRSATTRANDVGRGWWGFCGSVRVLPLRTTRGLELSAPREPMWTS